MSNYGECSECNIPLEPVFFMDEEFKVDDGRRYRTGRKRRAVDYLICPSCLKKQCVDDTFDGAFR